MTAIMLLHGLPGRGEQWRGVADALAPHRVLAPTFDGFGDDWADRNFPSSAHHARQIIEIAALEDPEGLVCVAWSFSCHPLLLALSEGLKCRQAILFDPSSDTYLQPPDRELFQQDAIAAFGPLFAEMGEADDRRLAQLSFAATGSRRTWDDLEEIQREPFIGSAAALRRAFAGDASPETLTEEMLARVTAPVVVASGNKSRQMFRLAASRLSSLIPGTRFISVKDADHLWPVSSPESFASFIKREIGGARI
ncbi:alpha/beta fold hydrolase [Qipengyuania sphaerica]|uniref:alpha/beta fold hydrolase n=1 Tax=Qipengyuania sphaerica TaxID=2867243 RepID=UPI001C891D27|nr:alpha/beta hydrolase [Qipengyuania sphaerica]MBX7541998.1 alpha/beta hydrolase [Qipengyuania sphaerica]